MLLIDSLAKWIEAARPARSTVNRRRYELNHWLRRGGCESCSGVTRFVIDKWVADAKSFGVADSTQEGKTMLAAAIAVRLSADPAVVRGVYIDHSVTLQSARYVEFSVPRAIDRRAASVASTSVNVAWVTNLPDDAATIEAYVRAFRVRGVEIVAGGGSWYAGYRPASQQIATLTALNAALPADARPWRWSLGDETTPAALTDLRTIADACVTAGIPTTLVQVPEYHAQTLTTLGSRIPVVSCDPYPFFQAGLPSNPPQGPAALTWFRSNCRDVVARSKTSGVNPIIMTQGFGGDGLFRVPTLAQTRWMVWTAIAAGSPGAIVFAHGMPSPDGGPTPPPQSLVDWQRQTEVLTPAGEEVAKTFRRLQSVETLLQGSATETGPAITAPAAGDVSAFVRTASGRRLLIVVADPDQPQRTLKMTLPGASSVTPIASSTGGSFTVLPWPWRLIWPASLSVSVQPGDAWVGEVR